MSIGLRNQRARIYTYSDTGSDGFAKARYTFSIERWCRFEPASSREQTLAAKADHRLDGWITVADETSVGIHDLIVVSGVQYRVTGIEHRKATRERVCTVALTEEDLDVVES